MRDRTKVHFNNILSTFSGEDGGVSFILFKNFIETLDSKAKEGDDNAEQIITMVVRFSRMIQLSQELHNKD